MIQPAPLCVVMLVSSMLLRLGAAATRQAGRCDPGPRRAVDASMIPYPRVLRSPWRSGQRRDRDHRDPNVAVGLARDGAAIGQLSRPPEPFPVRAIAPIRLERPLIHARLWVAEAR